MLIVLGVTLFIIMILIITLALLRASKISEEKAKHLK